MISVIQSAPSMLAAMLIFFGTQATVNSATAATINEECHALYSQFLQSTTFHQAGESAAKMHDLGCWPALQNTQQSESASTTGWDCDSLGAFVKENGDPEWQKMYTPESVVLYNDDRSLHEVLQSKTSAEERSPVYHHFSNRNKVVSKTEVPPAGGVRAVECTAQVRTGHGNKTVYYYLDRDSDGDEFWGWIYL